MDPEPFWSARRRLARAEKHISDFDAAANSYLDSKPLEPIAQVDPSRSHVFHKLLFHPAPDTLTDCTFDAISNLRASLDNAAFAIVYAYCPAVAERVHFPISNEESSLDSLLMEGRYIKAFPPEIHTFLRKLQPYKGGNGHLLWTLNRIRRQAEHRLLIRCAPHASFRLINASISPPDAPYQFFEYVEGGSEDGIVFAIGPIGSKFEYEVDIAFLITFGDGVDIVAGTGVSSSLKRIRNKVFSVINELETEAKLIGLI